MIVTDEKQTRANPPHPTELSVGGMTCGNCARHVVEAIQSVPEVAGASVLLENGRATVRWKQTTNLPAVLSAVKAAGYDVEAAEEEEQGCGHDHSAKEKTSWSPLEGWRFSVVLGLICTVPLIVAEWVLGLGEQPTFHWVAFALALPVQVLCGARFYVGAWRQLRIGSSNMDTLVALGSTTAFSYSAWALFAGVHGHLYFMESASIITLVGLGHWVEALTSSKAESSLHALLHLAPETARRRNADGSETEVPVHDLHSGDAVVLKPGDRVPVDGEVLEGTSAVDESMLTGESLPVDKAVSAKLFAGTLNLNGRLVMRVTATGEATALAHIIAAVERAQNSRAEIQRLGDRVSSIFVPVVVTIAIVTGLCWGLMPEQARQASQWLGQYLWHASVPSSALASAFILAAAVLIVACPCAMGLATPIAIMAGANAAARRGILIRDALALERAGKITALVFDKTGTLTQGKPAAVGREVFNATPGLDTVKLAAALARQSNHPVSQAVASASSEAMQLADWQELSGSGVQARGSSGASVRLGSYRWLRETGVDLSSGAKFEDEWSGRGATVIGVSSDKQLLGAFAVQDSLKPGATEVVRRLRTSGLKVYLVTGDNARTAAAIAREAGIDAALVRAESRPVQKSEFIHALQQQGERVAFVGDGINDAPALEAADLGIAVSRASDVARAAADIILLKSEIQAVPEALGLARATLRTIKQNLFWAFFYNSAGIPLAALGFLSPFLCAFAMGFSDLVVIGNALRLMRWRSPKNPS